MNAMGGYDVEDISVGMQASFSKTVTETDIVLFAGITGDNNPVHIDALAAAESIFKGRIAHGMLSVGFISAVLGTRLPGPGAIYLSQNLKFLAPVRIGDTVKATCEVVAVLPQRRRVTLKTLCQVGEQVVIEGEAVMMVSSQAR